MMNKYIIAMAVAAGMCAASSCSSDMPGEEQPTFGTLSTASLTINVQNEDGTMSRADEEGIDTSEFIIEIKNAAEEIVEIENNKEEHVKRCAVKDLPKAIMLPCDSCYTITAVSPGEKKKASWTPYYIGSSKKPFKIEENVITEAEPVICSLAVTQITVKFLNALEDMVDNDCTVDVGVEGDNETALTFDLDKIKANTPGYLDVKAGSKIGAKISCTINGEAITLHEEWESKTDTQHHIFEFKVKTSEGEK